jgi:hypothetical protein
MSQFMTNPSKEHIKKALHIVKYVKLTINGKIIYNGKSQEGIVAYADADWASDIDTRRSITGYVVKLAGAPVSWVSRKQKTVATSSTQAEYMSLSAACTQLTWIQSLYKELGFNVHGMELNIDNQGAIFTAQNNNVDRKMKHIDIQYHFCREHVECGRVVLYYVPTNEQQADILTKNLTHVKFAELRSKIGLQIL